MVLGLGVACKGKNKPSRRQATTISDQWVPDGQPTFLIPTRANIGLVVLTPLPIRPFSPSM
jgi:hypothetical protein